MIDDRIYFIELNIESMVIIHKGVMEENQFDSIILRTIHLNIVKLRRNMLLISWLHKNNHQ